MDKVGELYTDIQSEHFCSTRESIPCLEVWSFTLLEFHGNSKAQTATAKKTPDSRTPKHYYNLVKCVCAGCSNMDEICHCVVVGPLCMNMLCSFGCKSCVLVGLFFCVMLFIVIFLNL